MPAVAQKVNFQSQILPILSKRCFECHSAAHTGSNGRLKKPKGRVEFDSLAGIKKISRSEERGYARSEERQSEVGYEEPIDSPKTHLN